MQIVRSRRQLGELAQKERAAGRRVALVPTMGALHPGHLSLVTLARQRADRVWLSIFVNPTQFDDPKDLAAYPDVFASDVRACENAGVDVIYAPPVEDLYPEGAETWVEVSQLSQPLCGAARSGHFRGVATVVAKLLLAASPAVAVFGEKDFQQLSVIRRMVRDLGFDTEVLGGPIVREPDGLALSSRNTHLTAEARGAALCLWRALELAEGQVARGERSRDALLGAVRSLIAAEPSAVLDYAELCQPETLATAPSQLEGPTLLALAAFFPSRQGQGERVRLIDNRVLLPEPRGQDEEMQP